VASCFAGTQPGTCKAQLAPAVAAQGDSLDLLPRSRVPALGSAALLHPKDTSCKYSSQPCVLHLIRAAATRCAAATPITWSNPHFSLSCPPHQPKDAPEPAATAGAVVTCFFDWRGSDKERIDSLPNDAVVSSTFVRQVCRAVFPC